jgi:iron complex outermembrane recepter protein
MKPPDFSFPGRCRNLLLLAGMYLPLLAAGQARISGLVTEATSGRALPGAHLSLEGYFLTTVTDPSGRYLFTGLKQGEYQVVVSFMGFRTDTVYLRLHNDTVMNIRMREAAILGEEVNIYATRAQEKYPTAFSLITRKDLNSVNMGRDLPFLMQSTPSTIVTSDAGNGIGYTGMTIRGTDLTRINVTINGIPLNDAESQGVWFVDLPDLASSTADIQVQRGVGTSTNGAGAFGATVNILTSSMKPEPYGEADLSAGSYGSFKSTLRFGSGLFGKYFAVDGRASYLTSDGYIDRAASKLKSFYVAAGYYGKNTTLKLITFSGTEKTYQAWEGVPKDSLLTNRTFNPAGLYYDTAGQIQYYKNQTDNYQQDHYQLIISHNILKEWNLNAGVFYTHGFGYYENYEADQPFADYGLQDVILGEDTIASTNLVNRKYLNNDFYGVTFSSNYAYHDRLKFIVGGGYSYYYGEHYGKVTWAQYASNSTNEWNWYYNTGIKKDFNIYTKLTYTILGKLTLFADLQYRWVSYAMNGIEDKLQNITQEHTFNFFNPKAGIFYDITQQSNAYLSFGIGNREPSRSNYTDAPAGQSPTFETLYDCELGYNYHGKVIEAGANLYYMNYRNQLVLTGQINDVGEAIMVNVPKSYRAGIELSAGIRVLKNLEWDLQGTFSSNQVRDFTFYVDEYDAGWNYQGQQSTYMGNSFLSFSPAVSAASVIRYEPLKRLTLSFTSRYVGRQYIDNSSDVSRSLDPWFVNNLGAAYEVKTKVFKELSFRVMIYNLFGSKYESNAWVYPYLLNGRYQEMNGYFPQAPVNFMAGMTLRL